MKKWLFCALALLLLCLLLPSRSASDFPTRAEIAAMTGEEATAALKDAPRSAVLDAWGEPDATLSGLYGDIYYGPEGQNLFLYYDVCPNSAPRVYAVGTDIP